MMGPTARLIEEKKPAEGQSDGTPVLLLPDKPSIAVLPFANMSGDPEQEYFADGMPRHTLGHGCRLTLCRYPKPCTIAVKVFSRCWLRSACDQPFLVCCSAASRRCSCRASLRESLDPMPRSASSTGASVPLDRANQRHLPRLHQRSRQGARLQRTRYGGQPPMADRPGREC
jgi:hypothetical protein